MSRSITSREATEVPEPSNPAAVKDEVIRRTAWARHASTSFSLAQQDLQPDLGPRIGLELVLMAWWSRSNAARAEPMIRSGRPGGSIRSARQCTDRAS